MTRNKLLVGVIILAIGAYIGLALAQEVTMTYGPKQEIASYLSVFQVTANKIGFFNSRNSKLYIYDLDLNRCEKILQLQSLGSPLLEVRKY